MQTQDTHIADYFHQIWMKIDRNVFSGCSQVNSANVHKPDLLHIIYLGHFTYIMKWIEGFRKKHKQQQVFDDILKALLRGMAWVAPKEVKSYR